jgi:short-subunit dehydrogenase
MQLQGRKILLTGGSAGIGAALARELARRGAELVLAARDGEKLARVAAECNALGARALAVTADVAKHADCQTLVERAIKELGGLDILVNNAGMTMWSRFDALTDLSVFERLMAVNYLGTVYLTSHALPALKASRGLIVGVASVAGLTGVPERTGYAASKHAMIGFLESLRIELSGTGVDVTVIAPDFVVSEVHRRALGPDGKPLGVSPMQTARIMSAEDCARHIVSAIEKRQRLSILSLRGRAARWVKLIAPQLIDRIAANAIQRRY